jgi:hypothetical protein
VLSAFNLNIEIVAPECIVPGISYRQKFWFIMLLPLSVGALLGLVFALVWLHKALVMRQAKKDWFTHRPALVSSGLALIYILYLYLTRTVFDVFNCTPTLPPDGYLHLGVANGERCGVPGGTQLVLMPSAVAGLVVYTFGYPALVGATIWRNRRLAMLDQLLKAKGTGDDRLSNPMAYDLRRSLSRTYFQFKPDYIMWILAILLRKFFISITAVVFAKNSSFQMAACLLVMFLAYSAQMMFRPYLSPGEYDAVLKSHAESAFTSAAHAEIRAQIANIATRGKRATRKNLLNFEGKVDRSAVLGLLTSWLFNYNTVEQIMLFCAVIVCLMGIMYQANSSSSFYPGALDGVTAVVMIDIIFAILYYAGVLFGEIAILYNEENKRRQLERAAKSAAKAAREGAGAKEGAAGDAGSTRRLGRLVGEDGELQLGLTETETNPLFLGANAKRSDLDVKDVLAQDAPDEAFWAAFRAGFESLSSRLAEANAKVSEMRRLEAAAASSASSAVPSGGGGGGGGGGGASRAGASDEPAVARIKTAKKAFGPTSAAGKGSASALLKTKVSTKRAELL